MKKPFPFILIALLLPLACVQFQTEQPRIPAGGDNQFNCGLPSFQPEFVNFHMEDWPDAREKIEQELSEVPGLLPVSNAKGDLRLRITIEAFPRGKHHADFMEGDPFAFTGRRLSQLAFRWSFGIIPIYESRERKLTFEIWEGDSLRQSYDYTTHYYVLVGLPVLFLAPFFDAPDIRADALEKTQRFMVDACNNSSYAFGVN